MDSKFSLDIPLHPFLGCIGSPLRWEARSSIVPAENGGTWTHPKPVPGTPSICRKRPRRVAVYGDGHAAMGDGEVAGTGIEIPMRVRLQVNVIRGRRFAGRDLKMKSTSWPSALTPTRRCAPHRLHRAGRLDAHRLPDFGARRLRAAFKSRKNPSSGDGGPELRGHGQIHKRFLPPPRK